MIWIKLSFNYNDIENANFKSFRIVMNTISLNYQGILNYFDNRSANTSARSFNAKIKAFRAQFRGVRNVDFFYLDLQLFFLNPKIPQLFAPDPKFFLFRLTKIYA